MEIETVYDPWTGESWPEWEDGSSPLLLTGGQKSQRAESGPVHVHWLEVTFPYGSVEQVERLLREYVPTTFQDASHGRWAYEYQRIDGLGAAVLWTARRPDIHVILPGQWCGCLTNERMQVLLDTVTRGGYQASGDGGESDSEATGAELYPSEAADESSAMSNRKGRALPPARVTRLDLTFDDAQRLVTPSMVREAIKRGEMRGGHVRRVTYQESLLGGNSDGDTVYMGAGSSRQRVIVYDKGAESKGALNVIRWEMRIREEPAETMADLLVSSPVSEWGRVWAERLVSIVDFRVGGTDRATRRTRCPWYAAIVGAAKKVKAYIAQAPRSLEQVKGWLGRQVAPLLAAVVQAEGGAMDVVMELLDGGKRRWRGKHRLLMGAWAMATT